jgi:hypothetical protein
LAVEPIRSLKLVLEGGFVAPLRRDRFYFDPEGRETIAFDVPPLGAMGKLAVLTQFE